MGRCLLIVVFYTQKLITIYIAEICYAKLNLSFSTHLRKLCFFNFRFNTRRVMASTIPSMLAKATSSYLSEIEFSYSLAEPLGFLSELENDARSTLPSSSMWRALDDVLSTFAMLHTVRFTLGQHEPGADSFVVCVKRGLSSCNARGLLSFEPALRGMCIINPDLEHEIQ